MKLKELVKYLESIAPPAFQESYDNSGMQVGDPETEVDTVLLSLDITEEIIEEAVRKGCQLIISHHPLIFKALKRISGKTAVERVVRNAISNNIAVYSMHTNLDIIRGGVSYRMAEKMKLSNIDVLLALGNKLLKLVVFVPLEHAGKVRDAIFNAGAGYIGNYDRCSYNIRGEGTFRAGPGSDPYAGERGKEHTEEEIRIETVLPEHLKSSVIKAMIESHPYEEVAYDLYRIENTVPGAGLGCIGDLPDEPADKEFIEIISRVFDARGVRHTALKGRKIRKVALMGGAGGQYVNEAIAAGADAFVTADIKYHAFFDAGNDILLADIGHYESEIPAVEILHELITKKFPKFAVRFSEINTNPVNYSQVWQK
ncbi:MAG TPA: Nif3-like dinuclear metal center hexameric protein [Desulfobacteraceae bacterium]|nr:Nif3-like dinuclear metal center hexameric protein [Desulfobacteraceae bacterium]